MNTLLLFGMAAITIIAFVIGWLISTKIGQTRISGAESLAEKIISEATKEAERIGVDACLLVVPYYNKPTQEGLYEHFKTIAQNTNLPCIMYNVPSRTVANMSADTVIKLSQIDNIIGVKEASGNLEQISKIMRVPVSKARSVLSCVPVAAFDLALCAPAA